MKIEDANSLATIVGPTLGSGSMKGKCAPSVTINADVHYINMFYVLENQPRPLRVVYANINPYNVPMTLTSVTSDMCFCRDQVWPITSDLGGVDFLKFSFSTVLNELSNFTESLDDKRCACFVNNTMKVTGNNDNNNNHMSTTIDMAPNTFFSGFVFLPQFVSVERSLKELVDSSLGSSHVVSFAMESQHQLIKTKISFQSQPGLLQSQSAMPSSSSPSSARNAVSAAVPSWTVGRPNSLDIDFSFATYGVNLDWMFRVWYRVIPALTNTRVPSHVLSLVENRVNLLSNNLSWVGSLRPSNLCRTRSLAMGDEVPLLLLTGSETQSENVPASDLNIFQCLYDMLSSEVVDNTTTATASSTSAVMDQLMTVQTELNNGTTFSGI